MILSALTLSAALSMPNFALWIEVTNRKTKEVKKYHTALNFQPKLNDTIFTIPLHGTKKKIPIEHVNFTNWENGDVIWHWGLVIQDKPLIILNTSCDYEFKFNRFYPEVGGDNLHYKDHGITVQCHNPKD